MVLESLFGGALGGLLRLAPELMKLWDRKNEREHEARMMDRELKMAELRANQAMHTVDASVQLAQFDAYAAAHASQAQMARQGGWFVSAVSALVRPVVTYGIFAFYVACRVAGLVLAFSQSGDWRSVLANGWTSDDMAVLMLVLTFWFTGRAWESNRANR